MNQERENDAPNLPELPPEIMRNILVRLPVKSLIRFQCVCRDWENLIKNPSFIADHLKQSSHQNPSLIVEYGGMNLPLRMRYCFLDCRFQVSDVQNAPVNNSLKGARIVAPFEGRSLDAPIIRGSCNGLIFLEESPRWFLLWNPATSAVRHVPRTSTGDDFPCWTSGFGYSEDDDDDFKIVINYAELDEMINRVEVFSLKSGTWKVIDLGNFKDVELGYGTVTVNGAIFWSGIKRYDGYKKDKDVVVSFDIAKEVFTVIPRPHFDNNADEKLTACENKFAILRGISGDDYFTELWVLDEGTDASGKTWSWTKRYSSSPLSCTIESKAMWGNEIVCIPYLDYNVDEKLTVYWNNPAIVCDVCEDDETADWIDLWVFDESTDASGKTWSWTKRYSGPPLSCTSYSSMATRGSEIVCRPDSKEDNETGSNVLCRVNLATDEVKRFPIPYRGPIQRIYNYVESLISVDPSAHLYTQSSTSTSESSLCSSIKVKFIHW